MARAIDPAAESNSQFVGKSALCQMLGWSRPTLDLRLNTDRRFPVAKRGVKGGGWAFDPAAVIAYLTGCAPAPAASNPCQASGVTYSRSTLASGDPVVHTGEQTARQRRDQVRAEILEDKLRRDRCELVQAEVMRQAIRKMVAHIDKGIDQLADQIVEKLGLPESNADQIHELTNDLRATMAAELRALLEPELRNTPGRRWGKTPAAGDEA